MLHFHPSNASITSPQNLRCQHVARYQMRVQHREEVTKLTNLPALNLVLRIRCVPLDFEDSEWNTMDAYIQDYGDVHSVILRTPLYSSSIHTQDVEDSVEYDQRDVQDVHQLVIARISELFLDAVGMELQVESQWNHTLHSLTTHSQSGVL